MAFGVKLQVCTKVTHSCQREDQLRCLAEDRFWTYHPGKAICRSKQKDLKIPVIPVVVHVGNKADDNHGDPGSHDDKNASVDGRNPAQVDR